MGKKEHEALLLILIMTFFAALDYRALPLLLGADRYLYFFKPLMWLGLTGYVWSRPRRRFKGKLKLHNYILMWSTICAIIYICLYFAAGFIDGIGLSPYSKKWQGIILNLVSLGGVLAMMEYVRNYVLNLVKKKYFMMFAILVVFLFSAYRLNLRMLLSLQSWQQAVQYAGEYLLPEVMSNILLTYFVYIGGALPAIIYINLITMPQWLAPYLPDLRWITKAFIGIMLPLIFIIAVRQAYQQKAKKIKLREQEEYNPKAWIAASVLSILMIWFAVGVFQVFPTVILTGSMEPVLFPGDVALMLKCDVADIKTGDVIQYWTGEYFIVHRVMAIDENGFFQTKGDNNSAADANLVSPEQVRGKMIGSVPKLGKLTILLNSKREVPVQEVEF